MILSAVMNISDDWTLFGPYLDLICLTVQLSIPTPPIGQYCTYCHTYLYCNRAADDSRVLPFQDFFPSGRTWKTYQSPTLKHCRLNWSTRNLISRTNIFVLHLPTAERIWGWEGSGYCAGRDDLLDFRIVPRLPAAHSVSGFIPRIPPERYLQNHGEHSQRGSMHLENHK